MHKRDRLSRDLEFPSGNKFKARSGQQKRWQLAIPQTTDRFTFVHVFVPYCFYNTCHNTVCSHYMFFTLLLYWEVKGIVVELLVRRPPSQWRQFGSALQYVDLLNSLQNCVSALKDKFTLKRTILSLSFHPHIGGNSGELSKSRNGTKGHHLLHTFSLAATAKTLGFKKLCK